MGLRVMLASRSEWEHAQALDISGNSDAAIVHYRRSVRWHAPGLPYPERSLEALWRLGQRYEVQKDVHGALAAYRAMRSSILSTRSFYTPHKAWLAKADQRIAALMATFPRIPSDAGKSHAELSKEYLAQLKQSNRPQMLWTVILMLGFGGWTLGAIMFFERAFDENNRLILRQAKGWGALVIIGMVLFVIGAALA